jgi:hypothetical protein
MHKNQRLKKDDFNNDDFKLLSLAEFKNLNTEVHTKSNTLMQQLLDGLEWDIKKDRLIVAQNATKDKLNTWLQEEFNLKKMSSMEKVLNKITTFEKRVNSALINISYYDKDRVIRTKNTTTRSGAYLTNGDTGIIRKLTRKNCEECMGECPSLRKFIGVNNYTTLEVGDNIKYILNDGNILCNFEKEEEGEKGKSIKLQFQNGPGNVGVDYFHPALIIYDTNQFEFVRHCDIKDEIDIAYATTVHKAQGAEYRNVIVWLECWMWQGIPERKKLFYTAISRAKERCIIIGNQGVLVKAQQKIDTDYLSWFLNEAWIEAEYDVI